MHTLLLLGLINNSNEKIMNSRYDNHCHVATHPQNYNNNNNNNSNMLQLLFQELQISDIIHN